MQKAPLQEVGPDLLVRWWRGQDLNLRPLGYEPNELPDCSTPRRLGVDVGLYRSPADGGNLWSTRTAGPDGTVGSMRLPFRRRSPAPAPEPAGLPALRAERVLVALAVHSQQLDDRMARMEQRLDDLATTDTSFELPTQNDLLEVRLHSARVSAEVARVAVELQARIDDLAVQMPAVVAEDRAQRRARMLAETIIDLSDALDTGPVDLREPADAWAATA